MESTPRRQWALTPQAMRLHEQQQWHRRGELMVYVTVALALLLLGVWQVAQGVQLRQYMHRVKAMTSTVAAEPLPARPLPQLGWIKQANQLGGLVAEAGGKIKKLEMTADSVRMTLVSAPVNEEKLQDKIKETIGATPVKTKEHTWQW